MAGNNGWNLLDNVSIPNSDTEVLGYNKKWEDEDHNPDGICMCFVSDDGVWTVSMWCGTCNEWHAMSTDDPNIPEFVGPTHWREKPLKPEL